jgi:hypothetical protein
MQKEFIDSLTMLWNLLWAREQTLDGRKEGPFVRTDEKVSRELSERREFVRACSVRIDEQHLGVS